MSEEPEEESFEENDEDFDGDVADDIDDSDDIDLGDIDDDGVASFEEEEEPRARSGGGGSKADDADLLNSNYEQAVKANPKRQAVQRKRSRVIEGILDTAELSTEEGTAKAWQALQKQAEDAVTRKYDMKVEFTENDLVVHPSFGEGYVVEILTPTKMSVLFEDGLKRLTHNRG